MERVVSGMSALRPFIASLAGLCALVLVAAAAGYSTAPRGGDPVGPAHFLTADRCMPCHNSLTTRTGQDASIGIDWRGSIMANASRDPYWQGAGRRGGAQSSRKQGRSRGGGSPPPQPQARLRAAAPRRGGGGLCP